MDKGEDCMSFCWSCHVCRWKENQPKGQSCLGRTLWRFGRSQDCFFVRGELWRRDNVGQRKNVCRKSHSHLRTRSSFLIRSLEVTLNLQRRCFKRINRLWSTMTTYDRRCCKTYCIRPINVSLRNVRWRSSLFLLLLKVGASGLMFSYPEFRRSHKTKKAKELVHRNVWWHQDANKLLGAFVPPLRYSLWGRLTVLAVRWSPPGKHNSKGNFLLS